MRSMAFVVGALALAACPQSSPPDVDPQLGSTFDFDQGLGVPITGACLARKADVDPITGMAMCTVIEVSEAGCGAGRVSSDGDCVICQEGDGTLQTEDIGGHDVSGCTSGWIYEDGETATDCVATGGIFFVGDSVPAPGAHVSIECLSAP